MDGSEVETLPLGVGKVNLLNIKDLEKKANMLRRYIIKMIYLANSGHPGGSLSIADIITALYFRILKHDPHNPTWAERDRLIMSKGHAVPAQYAALALSGYFPVSWLWSLRKIDSPLQGHPSYGKVPGIEASTGSLGQGISIAVGMALSLKLRNVTNKTYVILGDGELQSGEVWEAAMSASHFKLGNLVAILDRNGIQIDGFTEDIMRLEPLVDKWKSFGWRVYTIDGNNMGQVVSTLEHLPFNSESPNIVIAKTTKGKGVSFMENKSHYHGTPPSKEEYEIAMRELGGDVE
ncbi:MAG: transketolase [Thermoplasmata archaeon]